MKITNMDWDVNMLDVCQSIDSMDDRRAADTLGISAERYADMSPLQRADLIFDLFEGSKRKQDELLGLPFEAEVPAGVAKKDIFGWLSEKFGHPCLRYNVA
jgi:hypothetical protein